MLQRLVKGAETPVSIDPSPFLRDNERVVSQFGPYFATSQRVLLVINRQGETEFHEIPYSKLESAEEIEVPNYPRVVRGAVIACGGIIVSLLWLTFVSVALIVAGVLLLIRGAFWKVGYYQLRAQGMQGGELRRWQLKRVGAGSFIASIHTITGRPPPE